MLQAERYYQLNMWRFGPNRDRSFAHIRGNGSIFHVIYLRVLSKKIKRLPRNMGFNIFVERVIPGKSIEARIIEVASEFEMSEKGRKCFRGLDIDLQIY
jgi:hypothetical protein